jgi:TolB-like protein/Tfp pilus assembly protein PilF
VLYFDNRSTDTADAYLADGLTEELISRLAGVERLTVRSRHLVRRYRGADADPAAVGRALNVRYIVTGTVRRAGERLRVNAELIVAASGSQVWGRQFDQAGADVFAIQEAVAREVATGIVGRLVPAEQRAIVVRPTRVPAAFDAVLRGNFLLARRDSLGFARAILEYETALRLDPGYTDALARLSLAYGLSDMIGFGLGLPRDTLVARALRAANEAVRRAPASAEAWTAMAVARHGADLRNLTSALEAARRAVTLDSTSAEALHQLGGLHLALMQADSARPYLHRALAIEPARPISLINFAEMASHRGDWAEARRWVDSALTFDRDFAVAHVLRVQASLYLGDTAAVFRALGEWQRLPTLSAGAMWLGALLALPPGDSLAIARFRAFSFPPNAPELLPGVGAWIASVWLVRLGDREGALLALERSRRAAMLRSTMQGAAFASLRNEPRFQRVLEESRP